RANLNPSANWVLPEDKEAAEVRTQAQLLLKRLAPDLRDTKPLLRDAEAWLKLVRSPQFDFGYQWIGWLHKADGSWTCTAKNSGSIDPQGTDAFVLIKSDNGEVKMVNVGRMQPGRATIQLGI